MSGSSDSPWVSETETQIKVAVSRTINIGNFENVKFDIEITSVVPAGDRVAPVVSDLRQKLERHLSRQYVRIKGEPDPIPLEKKTERKD